MAIAGFSKDLPQLVNVFDLLKGTSFEATITDSSVIDSFTPMVDNKPLVDAEGVIVQYAIIRLNFVENTTEGVATEVMGNFAMFQTGDRTDRRRVQRKANKGEFHLNEAETITNLCIKKYGKTKFVPKTYQEECEFFVNLVGEKVTITKHDSGELKAGGNWIDWEVTAV